MPPKDITGDVSAMQKFKYGCRRTYQRYLDASVPHRGLRWCMFVFLCLLYLARVVSYGGFHVITYALCIHLLYYLLMLITPQSDPVDEAQLPMASDDGEFRPFLPKVQEFVVWKSMTTAVLIALGLTMFSFLDIPVYWPILVMYFVFLFSFQMGGRVKHMVKHRYVPWNAGKPKFVPKSAS